MKNYNDKLNHLIPGGSHTYSRGRDQFPENAPHILKKGKGAYVWDIDSNKYLDFGMALRAVTLGYANDRVNQAAFAQIENGNNLSRASLVELEAAETFVDLIPSADMVKFCKNGSNATTAAIKLARAFTGRKYICVPNQHPFFSFDDWFIGSTVIKRGTLSDEAQFTLKFDYNDELSLQKCFDQYPNQIAAVMMEPASTITPCGNDCAAPSSLMACNECPMQSSNFLHRVKQLCQKNSTLFILDEMITGFRWSLKGAADFYGVEPDLVTFGKAMANGFSVAALAGRRDVMELGAIQTIGEERTFLLSSTHGGEMCSLGAFIETAKVYRELNVCEHLWDMGALLKNGMNDISNGLGLKNYFAVIGPPVSLNYSTKNSVGIDCLGFRTLFSQEMIKNHVLMPWISLSLSHTSTLINQTLDAVEKSLRIYKKALEGDLNEYLVGDSVKPVFRQFN